MATVGNAVTDGPNGVLSVTGASVVDTGGTIADTDPFADAPSKAETVGAEVTSFVAHPITVLTLSKVKKQTGSNEPPLLGLVGAIVKPRRVTADVTTARPMP